MWLKKETLRKKKQEYPQRVFKRFGQWIWNFSRGKKSFQPWICLFLEPLTQGLKYFPGWRLAPVKFSGQTYFCSDTTHFWPDKYPLRHISIKKFSPPPTPAPLLYMQPRTQCRKSGTQGAHPQRSAKSVLHLYIQLSLQFHVFNTVKF